MSSCPNLDEVAAHARAYLHNAESSNQVGYRLTLSLETDTDIEEFRKITKHRKNKAGGVYRMFLVDQKTESWKGEVLFLGWSATHASGAKVKFLLSDEADFQFFRSLEADNDKLVWDMVLVELTDDSDVVDQRAKEHVESIRGGELCRAAAIRCNDRMFQRWVHAVQGQAGWATQAECAEFIRSKCRIESRAELDHDKAAAERYHRWVSRPFAIWVGN